MIPVTILTGFLGVGKTTLLNRILTAPKSACTTTRGGRIAVVVNEFGDIGIDDKFIARNEGDIVELTNGCICCSARNDTMEVLLSLASRSRGGDHIDHVVIETTGLARPASLARFFLADSPMKTHYRLDGIVAVVDAFHGVSQMVQYPEVKEQIAVADVVLLNKMDLSEPGPVKNLQEWINGINPIAPVIQCTKETLPLDRILTIGGFDLTGKDHVLSEDDDHDHAHDRDIVAISIREERPLDRGKFKHWLTELVAMEGGDLLRYKGILAFANTDNRTILQGVHMINEMEDGGAWPNGVSPVTELVLIGRRLIDDVIRQGIRSCIAR